MYTIIPLCCIWLAGKASWWADWRSPSGFWGFWAFYPAQHRVSRSIEYLFIYYQWLFWIKYFDLLHHWIDSKQNHVQTRVSLYCTAIHCQILHRHMASWSVAKVKWVKWTLIICYAIFSWHTHKWVTITFYICSHLNSGCKRGPSKCITQAFILLNSGFYVVLGWSIRMSALSLESLSFIDYFFLQVQGMLVWRFMNNNKQYLNIYLIQVCHS